MIARTPERDFAEILGDKRNLSEEEQDLLPYLESADVSANRLITGISSRELRADRLAIRQSEIRSRQLMKRSMPPRIIAKREFRSRFFRSEAEQNLVDQIASLFDEKNKALSLLKKSIYNGFIETPAKIMSIQEFLKVQTEAWTERQRSHIPHGIQFLRNSISASPQTYYPRVVSSIPGGILKRLRVTASSG